MVAVAQARINDIPMYYGYTNKFLKDVFLLYGKPVEATLTNSCILLKPRTYCRKLSSLFEFNRSHIGRAGQLSVFSFET